MRRKDVSEKVGRVGRQNKETSTKGREGREGREAKTEEKKNGILKGKGKVSSKTK